MNRSRRRHDEAMWAQSSEPSTVDAAVVDRGRIGRKAGRGGTVWVAGTSRMTEGIAMRLARRLRERVGGHQPRCHRGAEAGGTSDDGGIHMLNGLGHS